jgi:death-on-curing protein
VKASPDNCFHLTVEIVREIHAEAIARFGGSDGERESALVESAVAAPQASFGGKSPYRDMAEVAAAYLYYRG